MSARTWSRSVNGVQNIGDVLFHAFGRDAVFGVVFELLLAPPFRFGHGAFHRAGDSVGVEDHLAVHIARRTSDGLDERCFGAQETFLVGVENRNERTLRNVEAFAQKVDADQHVECPEPQVPDDLNALQRIDVGVHVADANALLVQIFRQVFRHAFGEHCYQRAVTLGGRLADFTQHIVDLAFGRADFDRRIDKSGRTDHLLGEHTAGLLHLPVARCRRHRDGGRTHRVPLLEAQRPVVHAGRQPEAVFGQRCLTSEVTAIHAADLRDRDMAFVDEDQRVVGNVLEQRRRRLAGFAAGKIARIVLDAGAGACGFQHLQIETRALLKPLRFKQPPARASSSTSRCFSSSLIDRVACASVGFGVT